MQFLSRQRGVSLIEVMMSVLIFSIGLIGLAGLMVMSTRSNHSAYLRTQAVFLAGNMADRMSANPVGVWGGDYDSGSYPIGASTAANNDCGSGCTPDAIAQSDQRRWSSQLKTFLPDAAAVINCDASAAGFTPAGWTLGSPAVVASGSTVAVPAVPANPGQVGMRPPYGGTCKLRIQWSEQGLGDKDHRTAATQTFDWEFQP